MPVDRVQRIMDGDVHDRVDTRFVERIAVVGGVMQAFMAAVPALAFQRMTASPAGAATAPEDECDGHEGCGRR